MSFDTLFVANRGEIAAKIIRTAKGLGLRTVAMHSDADRDAAYVSSAHLSVAFPGSIPSDTYLNIPKIIHAAKQSGAQAIHPGYGFLSENAAFAKACEDAGLIFVGPSVAAIQKMANKREARAIAKNAGIPIIPGSDLPISSDEALMAFANTMAYPIMIKAAAGGGGRGMRLVHAEAELEEAIRAAKAEAKNAFGNDELILEQALTHARHIEVQIVCDQFGNGIHLGERDCSVQRRHQKVLEEAPAPGLSAVLRENLGAAALDLARAVHYSGVGTVEFLLDTHDKFYFLEMNTRLQVEHAVTEKVTGLDLIQLQLDVATGVPLSLKQTDIQIQGHAIEARLYAENEDFIPQSGVLHHFQIPQEPALDWAHDLRSGQNISSYYDAMQAKIIAHGRNREEARRRLLQGLSGLRFLGPVCNRGFLIRCLKDQRFISGLARTDFIRELPGNNLKLAGENWALAALICHVVSAQKFGPLFRNWHTGRGFKQQRRLLCGQEIQTLSISANPRFISVRLQDQEFRYSHCELDGQAIHYQQDEIGKKASFFVKDQYIFVATAEGDYHFEDQSYQGQVSHQSKATGQRKAPMDGRITKIAVKQGDRVQSGQLLLVMEAMKMEHQITADCDGVVEEIAVNLNSQVSPKQNLVTIKATP